MEQKYLKTYEGFKDFFRKKEKVDPNDWEASLEWIYVNYRSGKMSSLNW